MRKFIGFLALFVLSVMFLGAQTVTVTEPAAGDTWIKGSAYTITWTKSGTMPANVRITLRNAVSLAEVAVIADPAPNSGSYQWTIPTSTADGSYKVRVKAKGSTVQGDSGAFTIASAPPVGTITVTKPAAGDTWSKGVGYTITWTKSGNLPATVRISLLNAATLAEVALIQDNVPNSGSYPWTVPSNTADGSYKVRVAASGVASHGDSGAFTIVQPGTITVTKPGLNDTWIKGQSYAVTWTQTGNLPGQVDINLMDSGGTTVVKAIAASVPNNGTYPWLVPGDVADGQYLVRVKASGTAIHGDSDLFKIAATPPLGTILIVDPRPGDTWNNGQTHLVQWETSGNLPNAYKVSLMSADGTTVVKTLKESCVCCSLGWDWENNLVAGQFRIRVQAVGTNVFGESGVFSVSQNSVLITNPHGAARWEENKTYTITWTMTGNLPGTVNISLLHWNPASTHTIAQNAPNTGSYSWTVPGNLPIGTYYIYIQVRGTYIDNRSDPFTIFFVPPLVPVKVKK
jgi:hypothetical protein